MIRVPSRLPSLPLELPKARHSRRAHSSAHVVSSHPNRGQTPQRGRRGRRAHSTIWQIMEVDVVISPGHPREPRWRPRPKKNSSSPSPKCLRPWHVSARVYKIPRSERTFIATIARAIFAFGFFLPVHKYMEDGTGWTTCCVFTRDVPMGGYGVTVHVTEPNCCCFQDQHAYKEDNECRIIYCL